MATTAITPIPHIAVGQSVKDWRRRYIAATATLKDEEKKAMIPAYVHRTDGEVLIADNCSKAATLTAALDELESLIDGEPCKMLRVNEFWSLQPASKSYSGIVSFYFLLQSEAALAGIGNDMLVFKFLNSVPGGEKIFESNKAKIKADMTAAHVTEIFTVVKTKMSVKAKYAENNVSVKQEPSDVFVAEEQEEMPSWAADLRNEVCTIKSTLATIVPPLDESEIMLNNSANQLSDKSFKCWICDKKGHFSNKCPKRPCLKCGNTGHHERQCFSSKVQNKNPKFRKNNL